MQRYMALDDVYPPNDVMMMPLRVDPKVGPVSMHTRKS